MESKNNPISELNKDEFEPKDVMEIMDPHVIPIFFHDKKSEILRLLIDKELTLKEIKDHLEVNPGTIRRHLDDLLSTGLVVQTRTEINKFSMLMKFYRASAKKYRIKLNYDWP